MMQEVCCTWLKLNAYWKATRATKKWKIIAYDAIIRSRLLYGLETIHLAPSLEAGSLSIPEFEKDYGYDFDLYQPREY